MATNPVNPHVDVRRIVCNKSSRNGTNIALIVVHSTESANRTGVVDLQAIGEWFDNPRSQASSHVCIDSEGHSARFVADRDKAWHCAGFNSVSLGIEQVGRASQTSWTVTEQREAARWIARWSKLHGIPLQKGRVSGAGVIRPGVVRHSELGAVGGGHHDPGHDYPLHDVLEMARAYRRRL